MANVKKAILQMYIEDALTDIMPKSTTDRVVMTENGAEVTLATKLSAILADVALKANKTDVTAEISAAIDALIDGAPSTYDTLKEISAYIATDKSATEALNAAIGNKVDKVSGKGLSTNDLTDALKAKIDGLGSLASKSSVSENDLDAALKEKVNAASEGNHSHNNKTVLDGITAAKVLKWDNAPVIYAQASAPSNMTANDLLLKIVE